MFINILLVPCKPVLFWSTSKLDDPLNVFSFSLQWISSYWFCLILSWEMYFNLFPVEMWWFSHLSSLFQNIDLWKESFGNMETYSYLTSLAQFHSGLNLLHICSCVICYDSAPAASMKFVLVQVTFYSGLFLFCFLVLL